MRTIAYLLGALGLLTANEAVAQPACGERPEVLRHLAEEYQEAPVAIGLASNGGVLEVLAARDGASWTILITMPDGVSCLVAEGEGWQPVIRAAAVGHAS